MLFAFLLWSLFFCEFYYHSIFKPCVDSGGGGGVWEGGGGYVALVLRHLRSELKCFNDKTSSTALFRGVPDWEGGKGVSVGGTCQRGEVYQKLIQDKRYVRVFLLKCGTALINIELDIHFLDNHSGFEFRLF